MNKCIVCMLYALLAISCVDNTVYFDQPQPEDRKDLENLSYWYRGKYISADSTLLTIDKKTIVRQLFLESRRSKQEIDSNRNEYIQNNMLVDRLTNKRTYVKISGDTVFVTELEIDTLFNLSNADIARKVKGYLILNVKYDNVWSVAVLDLKWKTLSYNEVVSKELFNELAFISESEVIKDSISEDTIQMILKPTKKEFKDMLNRSALSLIGVYKKTK